MSRKGQQSAISISLLIIIVLIILFVGLGQFFGTAGDVMHTTANTGYVGWFFSNWLLMIVFTVITWMLYMIMRG